MIVATFKILAFLSSDVSACINTGFEDFEDAILDITAKTNLISCIVTKKLNILKSQNQLFILPNN